MAWTMMGVLLLAGGGPLAKEREILSQAIARGDPAEVARATRALEEAAATGAPLEVFDGQALGAPAAGLGIYHPLPNAVARDEEIYLYAQVRNHTVRRLPGAWFELALASDLVILDAAGAELARDMKFGTSKFTARAAHRDTFVSVALRVKGLPSGSYRARLVVHDEASARTAAVEIPFTVPGARE